MRISESPVVLAVVAFVAGFGVAWVVQSARLSPAGDAAADRTASAARPSVVPAAGPTVDLSRATPPPGANAASGPAATSATAGAPSADAESLLRSQAEADPAVLRGLMQRYPGERDAAAKSRIRSVLASINKPEVIGFATQLAASGDPATRREGLEMLQHLAPDSPEVRKVVRNALATEQSPDILVAALGALGPAAAPSAESDGIVTQLRTLAQHADPTVRSQSVLQLAQWDKSGSAQATLSQALADPSAEVRQAAVFALAQSNIRSDSAKAALLAIAGNANESRPLRGSALQALERFEMSKEEHAVYSQARSQVLGF